MRFAAIETSTEWCSVALWSDGEVAALERRAGNRHSELALPMLEKLLGKNELHAVAKCRSPRDNTLPGMKSNLDFSCAKQKNQLIRARSKL